MVNGVGGLRVRWSLVIQPDEFIKGLWKKEEENQTTRKCRMKTGKVCVLSVRKSWTCGTYCLVGQLKISLFVLK